MQNNKPTLLDWLGINRDIDFSKYRALGGLVTVTLIILIFALIIPALFQFFRAVTGWGDFGGIAEQHEAIRNTGFVVAALVGVPFIIWRSVVAQKQVNIAEQGHITDRINKAVEGLGAEKLVKNGDSESTQPNLEVRIGAIFSLERIAQDSDRDHIQIMEILCAYIKQNSPAETAQTPSKNLSQHQLITWVKKLPSPRSDIQTAIVVLGRRSTAQLLVEKKSEPFPRNSGYRLSLSDANLQKVSFVDLNFSKAFLNNSILDGAKMAQTFRIQTWCKRGLTTLPVWGFFSKRRKRLALVFSNQIFLTVELPKVISITLVSYGRT